MPAGWMGLTLRMPGSRCQVIVSGGPTARKFVAGGRQSTWTIGDADYG
jgi:hypothetical protein